MRTSNDTTFNPRRVLWGAFALVCMMGVLGASPAWAEGDNLVPNPSVEDADPNQSSEPAGWQTNSWGNVEATFRWVQSAHSGSRSVKCTLISGSEGDAKWWSVPFDVLPAKYTYTASVWYRSDVYTKFAIRAQDDDEDQVEWLFPQEAVPPSESWSLAYGTVELPSWATKASIMLVISKPGWVEADDFSFVEGYDPSLEDIVSSQDLVEQVDATMPDGWKPPRVSIVFDDGWVSAAEQAAPIMESFGFVATWFIIADFVDKPGYSADHVTSGQLEDLAEKGHELGSHSWDHPDLATLDSAQVRQQLESSKQRLEELGFVVAGLTPPGGSINEKDMGIVKEYYAYMRTIVGGLNEEPFDRYKLKCVTVTNTTSQNEIRMWIEEAGLQDAWLILVYHRVAPVAISDTFVTPGQFQETMALLAELDAKVLTMGEVLGVWTRPDPKPPVGDISLPPVTFDGSSWLDQPDTAGEGPKKSGGCHAGASAAQGSCWGIVLLAVSMVFLRRRAVKSRCAGL